MNRSPYIIRIVIIVACCMAVVACSTTKSNLKADGTSAGVQSETASREEKSLDRADTLIKRADAHMAQREFVQAKSLYDRVVSEKKAKPSGKVFNNLAVCEWNLKNYSAAVSAWEKAAKVDPSFADPYVHLGQLALKSGDYAKAEQMYRKLVDLDSKDLNSTIMLGVALRGKGDFVNAEKVYLRALELDHNQADALFAVAVLYHKFLGKPEVSLAYYERFASAKPEQAKAKKIQELMSQAKAEASVKTAQNKAPAVKEVR